ncbi:putative Heterokaryon incompatibility domain-containing protein [Seiridium cardinale]|uniref:Heterokaryon incompatibility domain-containing protein n=1 Tax=Seiridium cardinale TaxID=138064 RepID=A0ABR2XFB0_9PEZI
MTSFSRMDGHTYGNIVKPQYATISYTWARFLKHGAPSIRIDGVPWKLPTVDPHHFTVEDLNNAITTISRLTGLDHLWFDVVCIDVASLHYADPEVSMQQDIFFGANTGFIFLSRTHAAALSVLASVLTIFETNDIYQQKCPSSLIEATCTALRHVLSDPWFTSMWTLLEASMNPDAILLSSDGSATRLIARAYPDLERPSALRVNLDGHSSYSRQTPTGDGYASRHVSSGTTGYLTLRNVQHLGRILSTLTEIPMLGHIWLSKVSKVPLFTLIERSGLKSVAPFNLLYLYSSAKYRQEMQVGDRMKYIYTQIFGLPNPNIDREALTLQDLERHFSLEMVATYPLLNHLFWRVTPVKAGPTWSSSPDCEIPDLGLIMDLFVEFDSVYTTRRIQSDHGYRKLAFGGISHDFRPAANQWLAQNPPSMHGLLAITFDDTTFTRSDGTCGHLPFSSAWPSHSGLVVTENGSYTVSRNKQHQCINQFLLLSRREEVRLLVIGTGRNTDSSASVAFALILMRQKDEVGSLDACWIRIGLCLWLFQPSCNQHVTFYPGGNIDAEHWQPFDGVIR